MKDVTEHLTFGPFLASWTLALEAENKSARTVGNYLEGMDMFLRWLDEHHDETEVEDVTTEHCRAFIAYTVSTRSASTGRTRWAAMRQFFAWAHEEDEIASNPMATVKQPAADAEPEVDVLDESQVRAVLATCAGPSLIERRDLAILSLMFDSGIRVTALCTARMEKLDLRARTIEVVEKGGKTVLKPFGVKTARAIDRYLRARAKQPGSGSPTVFLSTRDGRPLNRNSVLLMVRRRGKQAGIQGLHPHVFRHTFTDRWLASGGSEGDLMELNGWSSRDMLGRYAKKTRGERARAAHQRLSPMDNLDG